MKTSLTMVPISKINALFPSVKHGIEKSLSNSGNGLDCDTVLNALNSGSYNLWIGFDGTNLSGCVVTEVHPTINDGPWVNIIAAYSRSKNGNAQLDALKEIEEFANQINATGIRFLSMRKGYEKRAIQLGYNPRFIEYIKVLNTGE